MSKVMSAADLADADYDELFSGSDDDDRKPDADDVDIAKQLESAIEKPRFSTANLKQLYELIEDGVVDLNPDYQREIVWSKNKMEGLIQSLFLNYYVPPVIFAVETDSQLQEKRICIDGKQRCSSISAFIKGEISFKSPTTGTRFWYTRYGLQKGKALPTAMRRKFDSISLQVVEYDHITADQQRDIFQRVQLGMALSSAERLQALPGPWRKYLQALEGQFFLAQGSLKDLLRKMDVTRGRAFQTLVAIAMMTFNEDRGRVHPTAQTMNTFLARTDEPEEIYKDKIEMALSIFIDVAKNHFATAFGIDEPRVAPVESWFIVYLIFTHMNSLSVERIARFINLMRTDIRSRHVDIRSNSKVSNDFYEFLKDVPRSKQPGETPAAAEYDYSRSKKRRRLDEVSDASYNGKSLGRGEKGSAVVLNLRSNGKSPPTTASAHPPPAYVPRQTAPLPAHPPPPISMDTPNIAPQQQAWQAQYAQQQTSQQTAQQAYSQQQAYQPQLYHQQQQHQHQQQHNAGRNQGHNQGHTNYGSRY